MYSIKHRENGIETIKSVESVSFDAGKKELTGYGSPSGGILTYATGTAFVMNEEGQTIGIYPLTKK